jgi:hypothetical protein
MNNEGKNIGGWLFLMGFQIMITIFIAIYALKNYIDFFLSPDFKNVLNLESFSQWKILYIYETGFYSYMIIGGTFIFIKFLTKKQRFRDFYSLFMILCILGYIISYLIASRVHGLPISKISELERSILGYLIWSAIWISYLFKGMRPQVTFIH